MLIYLLQVCTYYTDKLKRDDEKVDHGALTAPVGTETAPKDLRLCMPITAQEVPTEKRKGIIKVSLELLR